MKRTQERKLSMYITVQDFLLQQDSKIINKMPKFNDYLSQFADKIIAIQQVREVQELDRSGKKTTKDNLFDALVYQTMDIIRRLRAFALNEGDDDLSSAVSYSRKDLLTCADTILRDRAQVVLTAATSKLPLLTDYEVDQPLLDALQLAIDNFAQQISAPRQAITTRKDATRDLELLFDQTDEILNKMDVLSGMLRDSQPHFYNNYKDNRILIDPGYRPLSLRGIVRDQTGAPLPGVSIIIEGITQEYYTTPLGNFQIRSLPAGAHTLTLKRPGYPEVQKNIIIQDNQRTDIDITL